jgi:hypothetical protein
VADVAPHGRPPQPVALPGRRGASPGVGVEQPDGDVGLQHDLVTGLGVEQRPGRVRWGAQLDDPGAVVQGCGQVHDDRAVPGRDAVDLGGDGGRGVDDEHIARVEEPPDVGEPDVLHTGARGDEQADLVAAQATHLRWVRGSDGDRRRRRPWSGGG